MPKPKLMFFVGKGGVGKSTVSALTSLYNSLRQRTTLLVSMDPAHNQGDIFKSDIKEKPKLMNQNLWIKQVDTELWIKRYLKDTEEGISSRYNYQKAFSIKNYFKVLQFSPGIEEYAMLRAFESILLNHTDKDAIIFDMPPTALTLRFFSLPQITMTWIIELTRLREKIQKKQEIVSNIKFGKRSVETDPILSKLRKMKENYERLNQLFSSESVKINLVMRPDDLSQSESSRIQKKLSDLGKTIQKVVLNGSSNPDSLDAYQKTIPAKSFIMLPQSSSPLVGIQNLEGYLNPLEDKFKQLTAWDL